MPRAPRSSIVCLPVPLVKITAFLMMLAAIPFGPLAGQTPWPDQIQHVTRFLGPHALPVDELPDARPDTAAWLRLRGNYHHSEWDNTYAGLATLHLPLYSSRVSLRLHMVGYEYFEQKEAAVDFRHQKETRLQGSAVGDLNLATLITLWEESDQGPAVQGIINLRTASGGNLEQARFIDAPGYTIKVAAGKSWPLKTPLLKSLRAYTQAGLRVYQTRRDNFFQNDLFVHGLGLELNGKHWRIRQELAGYVGYFDRGDKPLVYRLALETLGKGPWQLGLEGQTGNIDYPFRSLRLDLTYHFSTARKGS